MISHAICKPFQRTFIIQDEPVLAVSVQEEEVLCDSDIRQLLAEPAGGSWRGPGLDSSSGQFNPGMVSDGTYLVSYTCITPLGCHFGDSVEILVDKLEKPDLESSASALCNDDQVQLSFQPHPNSSWKWFDGENQITDAPSGATLMTTREGFYYLEVSKHSCTVYSDTIELKLQEDSLYVPNVFTPNGDEKNNEFRIMANQLEDFSVSIFDRDGTPVFQSNDPDFAWRGDNRAPGVYFWQIHYRNCFNERKQYKGWVDLRR